MKRPESQTLVELIGYFAYGLINQSYQERILGKTGFGVGKMWSGSGLGYNYLKAPATEI